jgi:TrmH family RNA methyltransferase
VVEGEDLVDAGVAAGWAARFVLVAHDAPARAYGDAEVVEVPAKLLASVAGLAHPPRALAVFEMREHELPATGCVLYLDGIRDPGNVGTMLRTADAFGIAIALGPDTADPYSPKAARASMGAVFRVPFAWTGLPSGRPVVALDANADVSLPDADLTSDIVLCVGAEREGVSDSVREAADIVVSIPQQPNVDSLNAATAAAIVMYEWRRQQ